MRRQAVRLLLVLLILARCEGFLQGIGDPGGLKAKCQKGDADACQALKDNQDSVYDAIQQYKEVQEQRLVYQVTIVAGQVAEENKPPPETKACVDEGPEDDTEDEPANQSSECGPIDVGDCPHRSFWACLKKDGKTYWDYRPLRDIPGKWERWCLANCKRCHTTRARYKAMVDTVEVPEKFQRQWSGFVKRNWGVVIP